MKRTKIFLIIIAIFTMFSGCSEKNDVTDIDIGSLAGELYEKVEFEDELNIVDDIMIKKLYHIDNYIGAQVYISSGATAEEIAVFEFESEETAEEGLEKVMERMDEQKENFESYSPKEIQKLDNAVVKQIGKYLVSCVSNSDEAEKIISQYIEQAE